jgi:hypothetical protein
VRRQVSVPFGRLASVDELPKFAWVKDFGEVGNGSNYRCSAVNSGSPSTRPYDAQLAFPFAAILKSLIYIGTFFTGLWGKES